MSLSYEWHDLRGELTLTWPPQNIGHWWRLVCVLQVSQSHWHPLTSRWCCSAPFQGFQNGQSKMFHFTAAGVEWITDCQKNRPFVTFFLFVCELWALCQLWVLCPVWVFCTQTGQSSELSVHSSYLKQWLLFITEWGHGSAVIRG